MKNLIIYLLIICVFGILYKHEQTLHTLITQTHKPVKIETHPTPEQIELKPRKQIKYRF